MGLLPETTMNILRMDGDRGAPVVGSEPQPNVLGLIKVELLVRQDGWAGGELEGKRKLPGGEQQSGPRLTFGSPNDKDR